MSKTLDALEEASREAALSLEAAGVRAWDLMQIPIVNDDAAFENPIDYAFADLEPWLDYRGNPVLELGEMDGGRHSMFADLGESMGRLVYDVRSNRCYSEWSLD